MSEVTYALLVLIALLLIAVWLSLPTRVEREHEAALKRTMALNNRAIIDAFEAGDLTHAQWAELCTRVPGLEAAYQRKGTHTTN